MREAGSSFYRYDIIHQLKFVQRHRRQSAEGFPTIHVAGVPRCDEVPFRLPARVYVRLGSAHVRNRAEAGNA